MKIKILILTLALGSSSDAPAFYHTYNFNYRTKITDEAFTKYVAEFLNKGYITGHYARSIDGEFSHGRVEGLTKSGLEYLKNLMNK